MAIDKTIYNNGIKGMLSYWEIDALPRDYEVFKSMFREATEMEEGKRACFSQNNLTIYYDPAHNKPMSRLKQEKRMLQVLSRATYGMNKYNCRYIDKISKRQAIDGYDPNKGTKKPSFKSRLNRFVFYLNPKRLWYLITLYWNLRKVWSEDTKKYVEASKEYDALKKKTDETYPDNLEHNYKYDMVFGEWKPYIIKNNMNKT